MKQKQTTGNMYEFTFLVDEASALKAVEKSLAAFEGKKLNENAWGKRLLAFPIDKKTAAEYYTWQIEMNPAQIEEFKKKLNYDKLVMRYIILTSDSSIKPVQKPVVTEEPTSVE